MMSAQKSVAKTSDRPHQTGQGANERAMQQTRLHPLLRLQRNIGNQAVLKLLRSRTLQAKLTVNRPGNIYEQKADRVAEQIVSTTRPPVVQRKCACGGTPGPTGECEECRKKRLGLQTKL